MIATVSAVGSVSASRSVRSGRFYCTVKDVGIASPTVDLLYWMYQLLFHLETQHIFTAPDKGQVGGARVDVDVSIIQF